MDKQRTRSILLELFVGTLVLLCCVLGALQYRWNAAVSMALRDRLHATLSDSLDRLSRDFNAEISAVCLAIAPSSARDFDSAEAEVAARYEQWVKTARRRSLLRRVAMVIPRDESVELRFFDAQTNRFVPAAWPADWGGMEERLEHRGPPGRGGHYSQPAAVFEIPLFPQEREGPPSRRDGPGGPGFNRHELGWVLFELDTRYAAETLLPEVVQRYLGSGSDLEYQVEVLDRFDPRNVIYRSDAAAADLASTADASVPLFEVNWGRRQGRGGGPPDRQSGPGGNAGHWEMFVRHKAGSLEAVVARTQRRNLGVTAGVLLLMLATVGAWVRFTRRAHRLAELQMDFVAGISHELRTPLTVIHTAGYNLQGKVSANPAQVERYGKLIQQESGRLKDIVEQVLQFAGAKAGKAIQQREAADIGDIVDQAIEASGAVLETSHCTVEKKVEGGLPAVYVDARALRLALENLIGNAAKYASNGRGWIGISASTLAGPKGQTVEIRVQDRGPGIPADEQKHIFDPFFRGRRAIEDQVHGTGLGLNLVKRIVEAHGGTVAVRSTAGRGSEFIVRLPAMGTGA